MSPSNEIPSLAQAWDRMQPCSGLIGPADSMTQEMQGLCPGDTLMQEADTDTTKEMKRKNVLLSFYNQHSLFYLILLSNTSFK